MPSYASLPFTVPTTARAIHSGKGNGIHGAWNNECFVHFLFACCIRVREMARVSFHKRILLLCVCVFSCVIVFELCVLLPPVIPSHSISPVLVLYAKGVGEKSVLAVCLFGYM